MQYLIEFYNTCSWIVFDLILTSGNKSPLPTLIIVCPIYLKVIISCSFYSVALKQAIIV